MKIFIMSIYAHICVYKISIEKWRTFLRPLIANSLIWNLISGLVNARICSLPQCCLFTPNWNSCQEKDTSSFHFLIIYDFSLWDTFLHFKIYLGFKKKAIIISFQILPFINIIIVSSVKTLLKHEQAYSMTLEFIPSL